MSIFRRSMDRLFNWMLTKRRQEQEKVPRDYAVGMGPTFVLNPNHIIPTMEWKGYHMYFPNIDVNKVQKDTKEQDALINKTAVCLTKGSNFKKRGKIRSIKAGNNSVVIKSGDEEFTAGLDNVYLFPNTVDELQAEETMLQEHLKEIEEKKKFMADTEAKELDIDRFDAKRIAERIKSSQDPVEEVYRIITRKL